MGAEYLLQIAELHPVKEILWTDLFRSGDTAHTADHSPVVVLQVMQSGDVMVQVPLPCKCKLFLWRWWELSGRWGWAGAHWIFPMWHGFLWWHRVHSRHPRIISPQCSRRMEPPQSSPFPLWLWLVSSVSYRSGQSSTSSTPKCISWRHNWNKRHKNLILFWHPRRTWRRGRVPAQQYQYSAI